MRLETPRPTFWIPTLTETIGEGIGSASALAVLPHSCGFWAADEALPVETPRPTTVEVAGSRKQVSVPLRGRAEAELLRERPFVFYPFPHFFFRFEVLRVFEQRRERKGRERERESRGKEKNQKEAPPFPLDALSHRAAGS